MEASVSFYWKQGECIQTVAEDEIAEIFLCRLEVARGLKEEGFSYNLTTLKFFFESPHAIALWGIPLTLAILLRIITHRFHHQLIFPAYFFVIPVVFYIVVAIGGWDMDTLRANNWVLDVGKQSRPWYTFYTLFGELISDDQNV